MHRAANNGIMLWAENEDADGYDLRFYSLETANSADRPYLEVTWSQTAKTVYFLKDHLGSIRASVDETGAVVGYDDYGPWGKVLTGRSLATPWSAGQGAAMNKFTGKLFDDDYGLDWYYFGARYYDAAVGRWWSVDPLAGKYPGYSPFNYVLDNPYKFVDPDGSKVINPDKYVLGNPKVVKALMKIDAQIAKNTGLKSEEFLIIITGGDCYKKSGKIYSATTNQEISDSHPKSAHLIDKGARAVDLKIPGNKSKISKEDIHKAIIVVGIRQYKDNYNKAPHIHFGLPWKDGATSKTYKKGNIPFQEKELQQKNQKNKHPELRQRDF